MFQTTNQISHNPSEKYEFVNWDDDIPNIWKYQSHVPNHQPVIVFFPKKNHTAYIGLFSGASAQEYPGDYHLGPVVLFLRQIEGGKMLDSCSSDH